MENQTYVDRGKKVSNTYTRVRRVGRTTTGRRVKRNCARDASVPERGVGKRPGGGTSNKAIKANYVSTFSLSEESAKWRLLCGGGGGGGGVCVFGGARGLCITRRDKFRPNS